MGGARPIFFYIQSKMVDEIASLLYVLKLQWYLNIFDHLVYEDWAGHAPSLGYDLL